MKLLVIGHARWGKDSTCEIIQRDFGMSFSSSSLFAMERAVRPELEAMGLVYATQEDCYNDRVNLRAAWKVAIEKYNTPDGSRLCQELLAEGHDIYCGLRSRREFDACVIQEVFDHVIWVDASKRLPLEHASSMELEAADADWVIDNNRDPHDLVREVHILMTKLKGLL